MMFIHADAEAFGEMLQGYDKCLYLRNLSASLVHYKRILNVPGKQLIDCIILKTN